MKTPRSPRYLLICLWVLLPIFSSGQELDIHVERVYHDAGETLKMKYEYYHDTWSEQKVIHGQYAEWSSKGTLMRKMSYSHGEAYGTEKIYDKKGRLVRKTIWVKGKKYGEEQIFYASGQLKQSIEYRNGMKDGLHQFFDSKGVCRWKIYYRKGKRHGSWIQFDKNGKIKRTTEFTQGKKVLKPQPTQKKPQQ